MHSKNSNEWRSRAYGCLQMATLKVQQLAQRRALKRAVASLRKTRAKASVDRLVSMPVVTQRSGHADISPVATCCWGLP